MLTWALIFLVVFLVMLVLSFMGGAPGGGGTQATDFPRSARARKETTSRTRKM